MLDQTIEPMVDVTHFKDNQTIATSTPAIQQPLQAAMRREITENEVNIEMENLRTELENLQRTFMNEDRQKEAAEKQKLAEENQKLKKIY